MNDGESKSNSADAALDQLKKESEQMKKDAQKQQQQASENVTLLEAGKDKEVRNELPEADIPGVERTPGDGMDHKINKDLCNSAINIGSSTSATTTTKVAVSSSLNNDTHVSTDASETQVSVQDSATEELPSAVIPDTIKSPPGLPGEVERNEVMVTTPALADVLQNNNNNNNNVGNPQLPYFGSSDIASDSTLVTLTRHFQNMDVVKSLPSNIHAVAVETENGSSGFQRMSSTSQATDLQLQMPSAAASLVLGSSSSQPPPEAQSSPDSIISATMERTNYNELAEIPTAAGSEQQSQTLYEPFNSRSGWPVGLGGGGGGGSATNALGGSRFKALWSEATLDGENKVMNIILVNLAWTRALNLACEMCLDENIVLFKVFQRIARKIEFLNYLMDF